MNNQILVFSTKDLSGSDGIFSQEVEHDFQAHIDEIKHADGVHLRGETNIVVVTVKA